MNKSLFYIVVVAALGGFLFGFDSGVISGCEKAIQSEFALSAFWHGFIVSVALIGTVIGVFGAGAPSDKWGRRPTLWLMGILFLVSAVGCAFTPTNAAVGPHLLGWFRFIGGLAIGGVSVVVPLYIVEISPGRLRGRLVAMNQLNIVFGILISYVSNYFVARWMAQGGWFNDLCMWLAQVFATNAMTVEMVKWRVMLGMECLPIVLFMALLTTIPESPRWLVRVGRRIEAESVLRRIGFAEAGKTTAEVVAEIETSLKEVGRGESVRLFQRKYLKPIMLAFFIAFFNQVSGINAINYYAPRIFDMIFGKGSEMASLAGTMGVGTVNLIFTMLAFLVIDKFGRRVMIVCGAALMILMHSLVAWQLSLGEGCNATLAVLGILGFIAFFACSSGAVIWVYISEVFPNAVRAKGQALGCFTHWFMCTLISWAFPVVAERAGTWAFGFFAAMMLVQLLWAVFFMPETKGGTIEDIERRLGISEG